MLKTDQSFAKSHQQSRTLFRPEANGFADLRQRFPILSAEKTYMRKRVVPSFVLSFDQTEKIECVINFILFWRLLRKFYKVFQNSLVFNRFLLAFHTFLHQADHLFICVQAKMFQGDSATLDLIATDNKLSFDIWNNYHTIVTCRKNLTEQSTETGC